MCRRKFGALPGAARSAWGECLANDPAFRLYASLMAQQLPRQQQAERQPEICGVSCCAGKTLQEIQVEEARRAEAEAVRLREEQASLAAASAMAAAAASSGIHHQSPCVACPAPVHVSLP